MADVKSVGKILSKFLDLIMVKATCTNKQSKAVELERCKIKKLFKAMIEVKMTRGEGVRKMEGKEQGQTFIIQLTCYCYIRMGGEQISCN